MDYGPTEAVRAPVLRSAALRESASADPGGSPRFDRCCHRPRRRSRAGHRAAAAPDGGALWWMRCTPPRRAPESRRIALSAPAAWDRIVEVCTRLKNSWQGPATRDAVPHAWRSLRGCRCSPRRLPTPVLSCETRVEYNPGQVERAWFRLRGHHVIAESLAAPFAQLAKGDRRCPPATDVRDARVVIVHRHDLPLKERHEVGRVETVPHLIAQAAKAGVTSAAGDEANC